METKQQLDDKTIRNRIFSMILPITAENILQMTAGVVSMAMVGRINSIAVGAIGMSNILFRIIWSVFKGISTGASVFVAQSYGANNYNKLRSISEQAFILSIGFSILLQQILFWNAESLISIFNPTSNLLSDGVLYVKIISWSLPFAAIILLVAGILQGMGNAKIPMIIVAMLNIINIIFSYLLIFGKFGLPGLGLRGAGIAYNISYIVAALIGLYVLFRRDGTFDKIGGGFKLYFNRAESYQLMKFGLPTTFETSFWQLASILITRAILTYGETAYAAYQLGLQAEAISYMPAAGFGIAASTFIGQAIGSKDRELGKRYLKHLSKLTVIITLFAGGLLIFFPKIIMRILTDDPNVIAIGALYLFVMGIVQVPQNVSSLLNGALRGAGYAKIPMIVAGIGLWVIRIPLVLIMTNVLGAGIHWIWIVMGIDLIFRFFLSYIIFKKKDIFNNEVLLIN
ncbi:MATE family efflux transporter [Tissierella sp. Yu-01]|uniref:MATE family efflux transporter n=1 Tax=Tissierella sp. Yu-01 TaxID=3035694 RepID=UPI00240DDF28|nr:MATE family efflux transporter [Tissierella sp. Yu-01]WFA09933.1 MATE family efflux transporter [Tissierella sp. Yu-01]